MGEVNRQPSGLRAKPNRIISALDDLGRTTVEFKGDILAFLPGWNEIRQAAGELAVVAGQRDLLVLPLHGDLPAAPEDIYSAVVAR